MSAPTFSVARSALRDALAKIVAVTESGRMALPVRHHVLIDAKGDSATLTGTNFDSFVRVVMPCNVEAAGLVLLPAKRLAEIAANLPEGVAPTISVTKRLATITAGRARFEVAGLDVAEFPLWPEVSGESVTTPARVFVRAVSRVALHATKAESRPNYWAVRISTLRNHLVAAATDGNQCARLPIAGASALPECSLHTDGIPLLSKLFGGLPEAAELTVTSDGYRLHLTTSGVSALLPLNTGSFPDVERFLGLNATHTMVADRAELLAALERVSLASGDDNRVECSLNGTLTLRARDGIQGAEDVLDVVHEGDGEVRFGMNASYLRLALTTLSADAVFVSIEAPNRPIHFRNADQTADDPTIAMVQPLRID